MKTLPILAAAALLAAVPATAAAQSPLEGVWANPKGDVLVRIAPCGQQLCGRVVRATAKAKTKAAKQGTHQLVGATLLSGVTPAGAGRWKGQVFVPKLGRRVAGNLSLSGPRRLNVQGCVAGFLCKSQTWSRVS